MQITREDLNPCTIKLSIVADPEEVREGFTRAYKQLSKKVKLPGFRPGHAPRHLLEPVMDKGELNETAADNIVRELYKKALKEQDLHPEPSVRPVVELSAIQADEPKCEFSIKVPLPPMVDLGEYQGLPVEKPSADVTDEEVEYQLDKLREQRSTRIAVTDRGLEEGDYCVVNIKVEGDKPEGRNFMTVAGKTFPDLDQALLGMKVEEMKNLSLTFPDNFNEKDWAGKTNPCQVTVNSITSTQLPALDEEFAKAMKTESVDDLKTRLRSIIEEGKAEAAREIMTDRLLDTLIDRSTIHVPDAMWESLAERRLLEMVEEQREAGKTIEDYAKESGMTLEEMIAAWKEKAKLHVMRALGVREVFSREKMSLNTADLNKELYSMAGEYNLSPEEMLNLLKKNNAMEEIHFRAISRKVSDFLIEHADAKVPAGAGA